MTCVSATDAALHLCDRYWRLGVGNMLLSAGVLSSVGWHELATVCGSLSRPGRSCRRQRFCQGLWLRLRWSVGGRSVGRRPSVWPVHGFVVPGLVVFVGFFALTETAAMAQPPIGEVALDSDVVRTTVLLAALAVLPALFISMTSFVRIAVVLSMVRHAFGMPETPPNTVLISLALFVTMFVMAPTLQELNDRSVQPFLRDEMPLGLAIDNGSAAMRRFMLSQVEERDLELMYTIRDIPPQTSLDDIEIGILTPAFILSELRTAFTVGFLIMLPFLLIDLVVSSILLSLGMMMVPPATISLPIKVLMFVLIDGWSLILGGVAGGFG